MVNVKKILLVEDNSNDVELILESLLQLNLANEVVVLRDGAEAMEYLTYQAAYSERKHENPAVILLDIKMPKMDGIEVLAAIKSDEKLKAIPVVMLTSSREEPDLIKCYELGVNAYVVKPVNFKDFFDSVKQIGMFWAILNELPSDKDIIR